VRLDDVHIIRIGATGGRKGKLGSKGRNQMVALELGYFKIGLTAGVLEVV
jgi:hypothetical protein